MMDIFSGTQNVTLYCICRKNNVAVGPTTWFINGTAVTTTASEDNPYYRNNVPSPLIIPSFTATHAGTYGCGGFTNTPSVTIDLAILGKCNLFTCYTVIMLVLSMAFSVMVILNKTAKNCKPNHQLYSYLTRRKFWRMKYWQG